MSGKLRGVNEYTVVGDLGAGSFGQVLEVVRTANHDQGDDQGDEQATADEPTDEPVDARVVH